jgi:multiple sugar transport system substrate-binding protein
MHRFPLGTAVVLITVVLATGCTHPGSHPLTTLSPGPGSGTIVWLANPTAQTATNDSRRVLADAFERAYPSITVELQDGPTNTDSMRQLLEGELSSGQSTPDLYDGDVIWPYEFASRGYALPLSNYLPRSFWTDSFGSSSSSGGGASMVRDMTYHGAVYGVPEFIDEGFLYYRKDLLKKAGIAGPPQTWQQLAVDAMTLSKHHLAYQFAWQGDNYEGLTCDWLEFMADEFGELPDGISLASLPADLKSPQALQALAFLRQLITDHISPTNVDTFQEQTANYAFDSGQAAFMRGWDSAYADAISLASMLRPSQIGVELPPTFQGQRGPGWSALGGWGLFINPHTKNLTAALTFVKWMAGPQAQYILATQYSEIPANPAVLKDPDVRARNPVLDVAATDKRVVSRPAAEADYPLISQAIHACINAALPGATSKGLTAGTALDMAAQALSRLVSHPHGPPASQSPPCMSGATTSG